MKKSKLITSIVINFVIFICTAVTMFIYLFIYKNGSNLDVGGINSLKFFTNLSNVYSAFISLYLAIYEINMLRKKEYELPHWLLILRQTGVTSVGITFLVVIFFLAPTLGEQWYTMYAGIIFMQHFSSPLLAFISFVFFEKSQPLSLKENLFAVIPLFLYSIVYLLQVVVFKNWNDFYGFTFGGQVWAPFVVLPVMLLITYGISTLFSFLNKIVKK